MALNIEVETVLTRSPDTNALSGNPFGHENFVSSQAEVLIGPTNRSGGKSCTGDKASTLSVLSSAGSVNHTVQISPRDVLKRRTVLCPGMAVEIVQSTRHERIEYRYRAPFHMLVAYEQGVRRDGDTFVQELPRSSLRDLRKKLTIVPAGHEYHEVQELRTLSRIAFFYFDAATVPAFSKSGSDRLSPRLYFENSALWGTALKLTALIETESAESGHYVEALGVVLAHELTRTNSGKAAVQAPVRGGLAPWQQRIVADYIEEHLAKSISLATLAQLIGLSTYHFCRAFKQSFGIPPHRYQTSRRIECAKALLAKPNPSVTEIGLTVGFNQTSSFTAAFRRATGLTPTGYSRSFG
jgi:AraC family transcriptional regulator